MIGRHNSSFAPAAPPSAASFLAEMSLEAKPDKPAVRSLIFLCVQNAGRSQMAAGWARSLGEERVQVLSAGSDPADGVHDVAVDAMAEVGIDIRDQQPQRWADETIRSADAVITMGCGDTCPIFPGVRYVDWDIADPAGLSLGEVRPIRDEIRARVEALLSGLGVFRGSSPDAT